MNWIPIFYFGIHECQSIRLALSQWTYNAQLTAQINDGGFFAFPCKKGVSEYLSV
jgi:hypothetical protein